MVSMIVTNNSWHIMDVYKQKNKSLCISWMHENERLLHYATWLLDCREDVCSVVFINLVKWILSLGVREESSKDACVIQFNTVIFTLRLQRLHRKMKRKGIITLNISVG